jgi:hypothetical protein
MGDCSLVQYYLLIMVVQSARSRIPDFVQGFRLGISFSCVVQSASCGTPDFVLGFRASALPFLSPPCPSHGRKKGFGGSGA